MAAEPTTTPNQGIAQQPTHAMPVSIAMRIVVDIFSLENFNTAVISRGATDNHYGKPWSTLHGQGHESLVGCSNTACPRRYCPHRYFRHSVLSFCWYLAKITQHAG